MFSSAHAHQKVLASFCFVLFCCCFFFFLDHDQAHHHFTTLSCLVMPTCVVGCMVWIPNVSTA